MDFGSPMPDAVSLNLLIDTCIKSGKLLCAVDLFRALKNSESACVRPDVISYNTLIKGCAIEKKDRLAFEIFLELKKDPVLRPKDVTYNSLVDVCVRCNKIHKAWALVKEMLEGGQDIPKPDNFTFSTLMKGVKPLDPQAFGACNNMSELNKAFSLLNELK
jgi:pentatricopeptide repeat domain-containing protein 1